MSEYAIPKRIHYCWFGGNKKSAFIEKCISSWKKYLPDYEIIEWNETNFDININRFVRYAYEKKKWAYVTDFVRLYVVYKYGGIYLDTDVEITSSLDEFLVHRAFTGFESKFTPFTALFAAEKGHPWVRDMLKIYDCDSFVTDDGDIKMTTNTIHVSKLMLEKYNVVANNKHQELSEGLHLYPSTYFCRPSAECNYAIHHCDGSWVTGRRKAVRTLVKKVFGNRLALKIMDMKSNLQFGLGIRRVK